MKNATLFPLLAYTLMFENYAGKEYNLTFNDNEPNIKTYGSTAVKSTSPEEWKNSIKSQNRNELCACGSGKKYKKCCGK